VFGKGKEIIVPYTMTSSPNMLPQDFKLIPNSTFPCLSQYKKKYRKVKVRWKYRLEITMSKHQFNSQNIEGHKKHYQSSQSQHKLTK
jgi:hypothetical protein